MTPQRLDRTLKAFRIGDPDGVYPIFDPTGSRMSPGRWNRMGSPMIYASLSYSTAMLEKLANGLGQMPRNQHFIEITIDAGVSFERFSEPHHPGWDGTVMSVTRNYGHAWCVEGRSAILLAPSFVARMELNVLINPAHPDARNIHPDLPRPIWWDERVFP